MKTVRIALTAAMLLSLHATSFSMESTEQQTPVRRLSHDGTRKVLTGYSGGMFGSGIDTLDKLGQTYADGYVYALGSDADAPNRWAQVGEKDIKTPAHAQKFIDAVQAKGWILPEEALQPSINILSKESEAAFIRSNQIIIAQMIALKKCDEISHEDTNNLLILAVNAKKLREIHNLNYPSQKIKKNKLILKNPSQITNENIHLVIKNFVEKK
jgi:hypothetical protein